MSGRKISSALKISEVAAPSLKRIPSTENYKAVDYELNRFTGITTFHGLVRLYSGKWYAKLFWGSVLAVAVFFFLLNVTTLMRILNNKPTVSIVRYSVPTDGIRFPSVTVCNYNPVTKRYLQELRTTGDFTDDVFEYILTSYLQVENLYETYTHEELNRLHRSYLAYKKKYPDFKIDQFFMDAGYKCEDMFKICSFGGKSFSCCDFAHEILTDIGKCFQFHNFSKQEWRNKQYISGSFYGLQFIINVNWTQYPHVFLENSFETGIRFFVHARGVMPFLSSGGFSVSPGFRMYAGIIPTHYQLLPKDQWGSCKPSWEMDEEHYTDTYTSTNCEAHCVAKQFNQTCNCTPLRYNIDSKYSICNPLELYECINVNKWEEDEEYWYKKCPQCQIECDRWEYGLETSYANFYNPGARTYFEQKFHMKEHEVVLNIVVLDLYLKEIAHTEYEQVPGTSVTETLSDIGGNMGMFIGASIVTVAEITVFMLKVFWVWISKKRRKSVVRKVSSVSPSALSSTGTSASGNVSPIGRPIQFWMNDDDCDNNEQPASPRRTKVRFSASTLEDLESETDRPGNWPNRGENQSKEIKGNAQSEKLPTVTEILNGEAISC